MSGLSWGLPKASQTPNEVRRISPSEQGRKPRSTTFRTKNPRIMTGTRPFLLFISFQDSGSGSSSTRTMLTMQVAGFPPKRPGFRESTVRREFALTDAHTFTHRHTHRGALPISPCLTPSPCYQYPEPLPSGKPMLPVHWPCPCSISQLLPPLPSKWAQWGTSLAVQWLRLRDPSAGGRSSIPGQGTRPHMPQLKIPRAETRTWPS